MKTNITKNMTLLLSQSNKSFELYKDEKEKLYYIKRVKDSKVGLIGDIDEAEWMVLYGIEANKEDLKTIKFE